jgi:uncharacterized membrane protein YdjX (TVP38/TMEM64 family)
MNRLNRAALAKLALVLLVVAVLAWWGTRGVDFRALIARSVVFFRDAGPLAFFSAMALLPLVGFPSAPFTLAAGPVFAPVMGVGNVILCALAAMIVNVTLSYFIAARALRPLLVRLVNWLGYPVPEINRQTAWTVTLLIRIVPGTPFFLQNYILGLARVPFGIYLLVSVVVPSAYIVALILFGDALMRGDKSAMLWAGLIFLVAGGVLHQVRMRLKRTPGKTDGAPGP